MTFKRIVPPAAIRRAVRSGSTRGVRMAGEMLRRDANATCPIDTGTLRNSASVASIGTNGGNPAAVVSYGTPYAIIVHEKVGLNFQGAGRHKWLQLTGEENRGKYSEVISAAIKGAMP